MSLAAFLRIRDSQEKLTHKSVRPRIASGAALAVMSNHEVTPDAEGGIDLSREYARAVAMLGTR